MSILNHDCQPNCTPIFNGKNIIIKAIKPIKQGDQVNHLFVITIFYSFAKISSNLFLKEFLI